MPELPDVPAVSELLSGFVHAEWFAVVAPPGTSPEITAKLSQAIGQTLRLPDVSERLHEFYVTPIGSSPEETTAFIKGESERWRDLIAAMGIKAQ